MVASLREMCGAAILRDVKKWNGLKRILAVLVCALTCVQALFGFTRAAGAETLVLPPEPAAAAPAPSSVESFLPARVSLYPDNKALLQTRLIDEEISFFEIQRDVAGGAYSYEDLTCFYLDRIEACAASGMILTTLANAREAAAKCDRSPGNGSPLFGIPFVVLDSIDVAGAPTTGGAYLLRGRVPKTDAFLIRMLRVQGAIPIAKANLDELGGLVIRYDDKLVHGSSLGGVPVSPYGAKSDAGGSNFGAAGAVALNLAPFAVATDTVGETLKSAACNSVVGIRPTHALISRSGTIPVNPAFDVAVPFAKTVSEAAYLIYAMQGSDIDDAYQQQGAYEPIDDPMELAPASTAGALSGVRCLLGNASDQLPEDVTNALVLLGAELVGDLTYDPYAEEPVMERLSHTSYIYGVRESLNAFLAAERIGGVTNIPQLLRYNSGLGVEAVPYGQKRLNELSLISPPRHASVATVDTYIRNHGLERFMAENELDLILTANDALAQYDDAPLNPSVSLPLGSVRTDSGTAMLSAVLTARSGNDALAIRAASLLQAKLGPLRVKP